MATKRRSVQGLRMNVNRRLPFTLEEYARRYQLVLEELKRRGLDALLVHTPENITYLTGYETPGYYGYHCLVIPRQGQPVLVGRRLEVLTNAPEFSWLTQLAPVEDHHVPVDVTVRTLEKLGLARKRLGIEKGAWFFPVTEFEALHARLPRVRWEDASNTVEGARMVKSEAEVRVIRKAVAIADRAAAAGLRATRPGVTEDQIAGVLYKAWCDAGAEYTGLPNFIVSGRRSAAAHATWRGRKIGNNDHCIFEVAASKYRYCGAVFRTATVGKVKPKLRRLSDATIEALRAVVDTMRPGVACEKADKVGRDIIKRAGFGGHHHHRLGYSIGINQPPDWGEGQIISIRRGEQRLLQENMTFHLVPGCLILGEMGLVTSASVRVTATGCEILNTLPIQLFEN